MRNNQLWLIVAKLVLVLSIGAVLLLGEDAPLGELLLRALRLCGL